MHDGKFGEMPDWYPLFRAAKLNSVPAWEMAEKAPYWMNYALATENATNEAQNKREEKAAKARERKAKRGGR